MATYTKRLVHGSMFVLVMSLFSAVLGYGVRVILARSLTPAEYGLFYALFAFVSFFLFFRDLGLNQALARFIPQFIIKKKYDAVKTAITAAFSWQLLSSGVLASVLFFGANFLGMYYFKDANAAPGLVLFSWYIVFSMLFLLLQSVFQGLQKTTLFASAEPLRLVVMIGAILFFLKQGERVFAPLYAFTLSWIVLSIIMIPVFFSQFKFFSHKTKNILATSKNLFSYGLPVMITSIGARIVARIDTVILTYFVSLEQVGIYNVVLPSALLFLFFADAVAAVALPLLSELWAKKDMKKLKEWVRLVYTYSLALAAPCILLIFVFAEFFITLFFGTAYLGGVLAFRILLLGVLFLMLTRPLETTLSAMGKPGIVTKTILTVSAISTILNLALIPSFGIIGSAYATTGSYFIGMLLISKRMKEFISVNIPFNDWLKIAGSSIVFIATAYFTKSLLVLNAWIELVVSLTLAAGAYYLFIVIIFKVINLHEVRKYISLAK